MSSQADIVKKSSLKLKVYRSKNGSGPVGVLQGPKVFKEFWFVFRALVGGDKILEYHQNERKFQECAVYPKGVLHLESAMAVSYHNPEKKQQFSIELAGGSIIFLEAVSDALAREWMVCLNAVLFGKGSGPNGAMQYFAEVPVGSRLQYAGPCMLEVKDEELTVKTNDGSANLVRWKLAHIRSFKAKKDMLTVYSGSRSSTGVGEYHFKTSKSVQITHGIETVVKRLKYEALGRNQQMMITQQSSSHATLAPGITRDRPFTSERCRPLPAPPPPSHPAPSFTPPRTPSPGGVISVTSSMTAVPDHLPREVIADEVTPPRGHNRQYIPDFRTPEYSTVDSLKYSTVDPVKVYQRLDHHGVKGKQRSASPPTSDDGYSHLGHAPSLPQGNSSHSRSGSRSPIPPALPPPRQPHPPSEGYSKLDHGAGGEPNMAQSEEEYGKLDHCITGQPVSAPNEDGYGKLDHGQLVTAPSGYGKLDHGQLVTEGDGYGKLDHGQLVTEGDGYGKLDHGQLVTAPSEGDGYGKLDHGIRRQPAAAATNAPSGDDYGRLDHGVEYERVDHGSGGGGDEGYSKLGVPTPQPATDQRKTPPPVPAPYKPKPGSALPKMMNTASPQTKEGGGEVYSEIAPSIPHPKVSEGYSHLRHGGKSTPTVTTPTPEPVESSRQPSIHYSRHGNKPRPQSTIDPYASFSDAAISDISNTIKQENQQLQANGGEYSRLGVTSAPRQQQEVDSMGYSHPWTSYTQTLNEAANVVTRRASASEARAGTSKPSLHGTRMAQNGMKTGAPNEHQNGTETADEALYDKVTGEEEAPPPTPPPRGGTRRSHSPPQPACPQVEQETAGSR